MEKCITNAYADLYEAIWRQATEDEKNKQKVKIYIDVSEKLFPNILKYPLEERKTSSAMLKAIKDQYGEKGVNEFKKAVEKIKEVLPEVNKIVRSKIMAEAEKWPYNDKKPDKEYDGKITAIRNYILKKCMEVAA